MHSGAGVEALKAALTRDIEGDTSTSWPFDSDDVLSRGSNQTCSQDGETVNFHIQQSPSSAPQPEQNLQKVEHVPCGSIPESPQQQPNDVPKELSHLQIQHKQSQASEQISGEDFNTTGMQTPQKNAIPGASESGSVSQCSKLQHMGNGWTSGGQQMVPFAILIPCLLLQVDKDKGMQLRALYDKTKRTEMTKEEFIRHLKSMVGIPMLRLAVDKILARMNSNKSPLPYESSTLQKSPRMPSFPAGAPQLVGPHSFGQLQKLDPNSPTNLPLATSPVVSMLNDPGYPSIQNDAQNSRETDHQSGSHIAVVGSQIPSSSSRAINQERYCSAISGQGLNKLQKLHLASYSAADVNTSGSSSKSHRCDSQIRQLTNLSSMESSTTQGINMMSGRKRERQNSFNDPIKLQGGSLSQVSTIKELKSSPLSTAAYIKQKSVGHATKVQQKSLSTPQGTVVQRNGIPATSKDKPLEKHDVLLSSQNSSGMSPAGINVRTPQKEPSVGKKKPLQALGSSPPLPSKRQKVVGDFSDLSIKQLNDVTAISGVNLQEEEERLFSGPKEESRVSEASRRILHEEERGILLKTPLQKKLAEIMAKHGLKNISNDVERCLSLSVKERMRGLIRNLIRLSKERDNAEKPMHRKLTTSDVQQQITTLNCKAKEEWAKRQVEVEKIQKLDEIQPECTALDGEKDKNEGQEKSLKKNKDDDKMRTTAANVAARIAVGGDDMLAKWQFMAEQAHQKREREIDAVSTFQTGNGTSTKDNQGTEKRGLLNPLACGSVRKFGRNQVIMARTISVKDVIAVLEREPQMSRSMLIHRLYEGIRSMAAAK